MLSKPGSSRESSDRFKIQDEQYRFPYHYIPYFGADGVGVRSRTLLWGLEYLCYLAHIKELVCSLNPSSVLDIGCGDGRFIGMLDRGIARRVGIDLSERSICFAHAFYPEIEFRAGDACELDETFDLVVSIEVLEHVPDNQTGKFLRTLAERTNMGGHAIISVPTTVVPLNKKHYRHYDLELFREELASSGARLEIVKVDYVYRSSRLIELHLRLSYNRWWLIEFYPLQRVIWNYVWNKLRMARKENGTHLVIVLRKVAEVS